MTYVKVCGLVDPEDVLLLSKYAVDFCGLIFHPTAPSNISLSIAREIVAAAKEYGIIPVGVFVKQTREAICHTIEALAIDHVQLHGVEARGSYSILPENIVRLYTRIVAKEGTLVDDVSFDSQTFNYERDWMLYDIDKTDTQPFNWLKFTPPIQKKWFLAGKLSVNNIANALEQLSPTAVDINSGLCHKNSRLKDPALVGRFMEIIRRYG